MGFSRQEYWSGLPCPPPGDLPNPRTELRSPTLQEDSLPSEPPGKPKHMQGRTYYPHFTDEDLEAQTREISKTVLQELLKQHANSLIQFSPSSTDKELEILKT